MERNYEYLIGLGSNTDGAARLTEAKERIEVYAAHCRWGETLVTAPEGTVHSTPYHNCAALIYTPHTAEEVRAFFKELELKSGRTPKGKSQGIIPLDIDILAIDRQIVRPQDFNKKYIQETLKYLLTKPEFDTLHTPV